MVEEPFAACCGSSLLELFLCPRFFFPRGDMLSIGYPKDKPGLATPTRGATGLARGCLASGVLMLSLEASPFSLFLTRLPPSAAKPGSLSGSATT